MNFARQIFASILICVYSVPVFAQTDVVTVRSPKTGKTLERKGTIVEWLGNEITFETNNRTRKIKGDTVIGSQTAWTQEYLEGRKAMQSGQFERATQQLTAALSKEVRPWAKRIIRANLIEAHAIQNESAPMVNHFLVIIREDPGTRFLGLAPLPWTGGGAGLTINQSQLMNSKSRTAQLIGAAWSLAGSERDTAKELLNKLQSDPSPAAHLARAMLWKTALVTATEDHVQRWEMQLKAMPHRLRAGPLFVLAEGKSRLGQTDSAAIDFLKIPVLYPDQHNLAAAALYKCGTLLHNDGRIAEAKKLWQELIQKYPASLWASQVKDKL